MEDIKSIKLSDISPNKWNSRSKINVKTSANQELIASIKKVGVLQAICVRPKGKKYQIIYGERRFTCAKAAGLDKIPATVRDLDDKESRELTIIENMEREDLTPLEEAQGIQELISKKWDIKEIADQLGRSPEWVFRRSRITNLSDKWKAAIQEEDSDVFGASANKLAIISRLRQEDQDAFLDEASYEFKTMTVKDVEQETEYYSLELVNAPWDLKDSSLHPEAGSCADCTNRSACTPGLFDQFSDDEKTVSKKDRCLNNVCWRQKTEIFAKGKIEELKKEHKNLGFVVDFRVKSKYQVSPQYQEFSIKKSSKTAKGSIPIVKITETGISPVNYYKLESWATPAKTKSTAPKKKADGTPTAAAVKERTAKLKKRRDALVMANIKKTLEKAKLDDLKIEIDELPFVLIKMAAAFGTKTKYGDSHKKMWKDFETKDTNSSWHSLWEDIRPELSSHLIYRSDQPKIQSYAIEGVAKLLDIDIKALFADACKELPEPKSWKKK